MRKDLINAWIERNSPDGLSQLAVKSKVSASTIGNVRRGRVPSGPKRRDLANAIGASEDELFPLVDAGEEEQAS